MIKFKIAEELFKTEPLFLLDCSKKQLNKELSKWKGEYNQGGVGAMITFNLSDGNILRVVWVETFKFKGEDFGVLYHELFHLITRICEDRGVPIVCHHENGDCGDESAAYLYEYFVNKILEKLSKVKCQKKRK